MRISIDYCGACNYRPIAAALALLIEQSIGVKPDLIHSSRPGSFEITVDGVLLYSKCSTGIFPDNKEIVSCIKKSMDAPGDGPLGGSL
jgi:selT/selW/selH-like putative selenoprotein